LKLIAFCPERVFETFNEDEKASNSRKDIERTYCRNPMASFCRKTNNLFCMDRSDIK